MVSKDKKKKFSRENRKTNYSVNRFYDSIKYSLEGLKYAYTHEQSLLLHIFLSIVAITCGILFKITGTQWILLFIMMTVIIVAELINTAIEAVVDMITEEYNPLAKVAKDCGAAAAFVASVLAISVGAYVFVPQIIEMIFKR
jgi:diacylglycerol kinase